LNGENFETDISAKQLEAQKKTRLSRADEHKIRPECAETKTKQGQETTVSIMHYTL
jgi:hypothetical protein